MSPTYNCRIEVIKDSKFTLGEGPHWDADRQELLFVDLDGKKVVRYVPSTGKIYSVTVDGRVSPVLPVAGSPTKYLIGVEQEFKIMEWDGVSTVPTSLKTIALIKEAPTTRTNDGKCDPRGRLIAGTYDESEGTGGNLYRLDSDGKLIHLQSNIKISNGLAWSADHKTMYYIDSPTLHVEAFDYNIEDGSIRNRRSVFYLPDHGLNVGSPDGMAIDTDGNLWVAVFDASQVIHINPSSGALLGIIDFTNYASKITSVAFGGPNLDILYVTSADLAVGPTPPYRGYLFAVHDLSVKGAGPGVPYAQNCVKN